MQSQQNTRTALTLHDKDQGGCSIKVKVPCMDWRIYLVFNFLADVRGMCESDPDRTRASLVLRRLSLCILFCFFLQGRQEIGC